MGKFRAATFGRVALRKQGQISRILQLARKMELNVRCFWSCVPDRRLPPLSPLGILSKKTVQSRIGDGQSGGFSVANRNSIIQPIYCEKYRARYNSVTLPVGLQLFHRS